MEYCSNIFNSISVLISIIIALLAFKLSYDTVTTQKSIEILKLRLSVMEELRKFYISKIENINNDANIDKIRISIFPLFGKNINYYVNILIEVLNTYGYRIGFDDDTKAEWVITDIKKLFNLILEMMSEKELSGFISINKYKNTDEIIDRLNCWHKKLQVNTCNSDMKKNDLKNCKNCLFDNICETIKTFIFFLITSIIFAFLFAFIFKTMVVTIGNATRAFSVGNIKLNIMLISILVMYIFRKLCTKFIPIICSKLSYEIVNKIVLTAFIVLYFATYINGLTWFNDIKDYNIQIITLYFMLYGIQNNIKFSSKNNEL